MDKIKYNIEKCKKKAAFKAKPVKRIKLDLAKIKNAIEKSKSGKVVSDAKIAIVLEFDGEQVIVQEYGVLTFKTLKDKDKIKGIADKIYNIEINDN